MTHLIFCTKLQQESEAMNAPPFPGPLGEKIYGQISKKAWNMWVAHQTMLINEYRLSLLDPKSREFLLQEMQNYFFGEGSNKPQGFVNPE